MKKLLVFILDRNPTQGNILKYHLSSNGFNNVILFNTLEDCIYSIHKNIIPDFILADTDIKSTTDLEFLKLIKKNNPSIKVIFFSNDEDICHISALLEAGATDYIVRVGSNHNWIHELISNLHYLIKEELPSK
jgi:DNA-binding NtrC family response regulator